MATVAAPIHVDPPYFSTDAVLAHSHQQNEARRSGVSWAAVAAGAFATAALSLILLALGAGAGLSSLSPWSSSGVAPSKVGLAALVWLAAVEIISAGVGGYLAGRLRTKWVNVHSDEVYFRDTAHGFLVWAVALVATAAFLTSAANSMVGMEARNSSSRSEGAAIDPNRYFVDGMFRAGQPATAADAAVRSEVSLIFSESLAQREISAADKNYLVDLVVSSAGVSQPEAERRVSDAFSRDQQATDVARKAVAHTLYWLFVSLLLGAFTASFAATIGGRQRDHMHARSV